jgi:hypothetical protein
MAESQLGRQLGASVQASLADAAAYLALITRTNPRGSAGALLGRPDVAAVISETLSELREDARAAVEQAWWLAGAPQDASLTQLLADVSRIFGDPAHLHGLIRRAYASVPRREFAPGADEPGSSPAAQAAEERAQAVTAALLRWGRQAALRARMALSAAQGLGTTAAVLAAARDAQGRGERVRKRWHRNPASASCIWCRRLDGVTIGVSESFAPYLGGPASLPRTAARRVATPAGAARYGLPAGAPIVYAHPPRLYHGDLQGPLLHPFCGCSLEIIRRPGGPGVSSGGGQDDTGPAGQRSPAPRAPGGFLAAADIRGMPEDQYRSHLALLRAAAGELDAALRQLALRVVSGGRANRGLMADQTRRYFADSSASYVLAIIELMEYARAHQGPEFGFGPLDTEELAAGGLVLSGPALDGPAAVLAVIPGLEEDEQAVPARLARRAGLGVP